MLATTQVQKKNDQCTNVYLYIHIHIYGIQNVKKRQEQKERGDKRRTRRTTFFQHTYSARARIAMNVECAASKDDRRVNHE